MRKQRGCGHTGEVAKKKSCPGTGVRYGSKRGEGKSLLAPEAEGRNRDRRFPPSPFSLFFIFCYFTSLFPCFSIFLLYVSCLWDSQFSVRWFVVSFFFRAHFSFYFPIFFREAGIILPLLFLFLQPIFSLFCEGPGRKGKVTTQARRTREVEEEGTTAGQELRMRRRVYGVFPNHRGSWGRSRKELLVGGNGRTGGAVRGEHRKRGLVGREKIPDRVLVAT